MASYFNPLSCITVLHEFRYSYCGCFFGRTYKVRDKSTQSKLCFKKGKFYKRLYIKVTGRCPDCYFIKEGHYPYVPHLGIELIELVSLEPAPSTTLVDQSPVVDKPKDPTYERDQAILSSGKPVNFDRQGRPLSWYKGDEAQEFSIRRRESWVNDLESWEARANVLQDQTVSEVLGESLSSEEEDEDIFF